MTDAIPGLRSFWRAVAPGFTPRSGARALSAAGEVAPELAGSYADAIVVKGSREIRLKRSSASAASFIHLVRIVAAAALAVPNRTALIDILQRHRHRAIRYERNGPKKHIFTRRVDSGLPRCLRKCSANSCKIGGIFFSGSIGTCHGGRFSPSISRAKAHAARADRIFETA